MGHNTCKAGNDGTNTALCQLGIDAEGFLFQVAIGISDPFPSGGAYQTVSDGQVLQFNRFKYMLHGETLLHALLLIMSIL